MRLAIQVKTDPIKRKQLIAKVREEHLARHIHRAECDDTYTIDIENLYSFTFYLRKQEIAPTDIHMRRSRRKRDTSTPKALAQRINAILDTLWSIQDLHQLGHFPGAAQRDYRIIIDSLLL